jgi:CO dehydrogenase maturation factor
MGWPAPSACLNRYSLDEVEDVQIIVTMGRGGTGKTTFVACMTKYFIETGRHPLLLVDVDPDQNLGELVGVDLTAAGKQTISELLIQTFLEAGGTTVGVPPSERMEGKIWERGLYEGEYFDLMAIGPKWIEGCYCLPDAALKRALERLTKVYTYVLIDSPAGLEHLNRKITSDVDAIIDIIDPSQKAFNHVQRAYKIAKEIGIAFHHFFIVGGYRFPTRLEAGVAAATGLPYLGKIAYDAEVETYVLHGQSLLHLPPSSPTYTSITAILKQAGY